MNYLSLGLMIGLFCFSSCSNSPKVELKPGINYFGTLIDESSPINIDVAVNAMNGVDTLNAKFAGTVSEVCQTKGCWMNIVDSKGHNTVRVRFKDYGFFVPKNIGSKKAIVRGKMYWNESGVDELNHLAEDRGTGQKEIDNVSKSEKSLMIMADGVIIYN